MNNKAAFILLLLTIGLVLACEGDPSKVVGTGPDLDSDTDSDSDADGDIDTSGVAPPGCGDGTLDDDEACDDGGTESGDGCSANCLFVAEGWSCNPPGMPCRQIAKCGDGQTTFPELCDDGNLDSFDGCSDLCKVEIGYKCSGAPSVCTPTTCGDGLIEGAEGCDEGDDIPFDGCSTKCQKEPNCSAGACSSECGDGLVLGEECDDGNNLSGDGCSDTCTVESGYECLQEGCEDEATCTLEIAVIYRDFTAAHPDFALPMYPDPTCDAPTGAFGMVQDTLSGSWKPVQASPPSNSCATQIGDWFSDSAASSIIVDTLTLYPDGAGNFVNRYGENGEQWMGYPLDANGKPILPANWEPWTPNWQDCAAAGCVKALYGDQGVMPPTTPYDGNPLFFPIDEAGTDMFEGKIPEQYGYDGWPFEKDVPGFGTATHNFYFTSEVTYWFKFDASQDATLNFTGDDDVWVFVNGELAVDLGGAHVPLDGSVTINGSNNFGMEDGKVYRINVFHAERKRDGSSFRLTLGGFNTARSICRPDCGDGIVGLGEECDDGVLDGGYGECGPGCRLDEYCGDGIIQEGKEDCDDGNFSDADSCPSSCRFIIIE